MIRIMSSIFLIGTAGYFVFKNRYKLVNSAMRSPIGRRFFVASLMSIPGVKNKMMQTVFSGPAGGK
ncbi:hypothetical protein CVD25_04345 [Bacillus canaveralius]|uniref:Uncharacterized protein n=1 Tax=Bacillus canaveralius TaxID=1403243 RepID=A0A2N5GR92_9BACI|nr:MULTISPECIES: hypothetical protein [Bacillus]PLR85951.1 hypothetical protein CU635_02635 [Bacillus canaveralius]PLR87587.1 hypothetical protein CVD23_01565 [Bacillus sp. V33-4]PLS00070.1 hypothetical protein CVD25_04345 [Bacillus canaveralius]RSK56193.1 hypothetical protein EJA13_02205 [Bacillus canaveralius]